MAVILLVLGILVAVGLVQAAVWIPVVRRGRRRTSAFLAQFDAEVAASGERVIVAPEQAVYRGCTAHYGQVRGNGTILLTDRRLVFRKLTGGPVEVPTAAILSTRQAASFLSSRVGGQTHLIVETSDPAELGFFVADLPRWEAALASVRSG